MNGVKKRIASSMSWKLAVSVVSVAAAMFIGSSQLSAQPPGSTKAVEVGIVSDHPDFTGSWLRDAGRGAKRLQNYGFDETVACQELKDALGAPLKRCSVPFDKLKEYLHPEHSRGWGLPTSACRRNGIVPPTTPAFLFWHLTFTQVSGLEIDHLTPTVGVQPQDLDGRPNPPGPTHLYYEATRLAGLIRATLCSKPQILLLIRPV
jgi:hypothetical protein